MSAVHPEQPDATDWKIIDILRREYCNNSQIAAEIQTSEGTVRRRIQRLLQEKILRIRGLVNPDQLINRQIVVIGVNITDSRLLDEKARELQTLKDVLSVSIVTGRYDLLVELVVDSNHGMVDFLTGELANVKGIRSTETFLLLKNYGKYI